MHRSDKVVLAGTAEVRGDIETPIAPPDAWFRRFK
jgi:hypothetical protein